MEYETIFTRRDVYEWAKEEITETNTQISHQTTIDFCGWDCEIDTVIEKKDIVFRTSYDNVEHYAIYFGDTVRIMEKENGLSVFMDESNDNRFSTYKLKKENIYCVKDIVTTGMGTAFFKSEKEAFDFVCEKYERININDAIKIINDESQKIIKKYKKEGIFLRLIGPDYNVLFPKEKIDYDIYQWHFFIYHEFFKYQGPPYRLEILTKHTPGSIEM